MTQGYLSTGHRIGPVTLYSVGSYARSLDDPLHISADPEASSGVDRLKTIAQNAFNRTLVDQNTFSLGARWELNPQMALKAQWDHT